MRISIIGHASSGKTSLALRVSEKLHIPHLHIDRLWFEAKGHKLQMGEGVERERVREHVRKGVLDFIGQDAWVSDGWYSRMQPLITERADMVLFLDISFVRRLFNHIRRMCKGTRHPELTGWDDFLFFYEMFRREFAHGANIRKFAQEHSTKVVTLRTYVDIERYLKNL